jgi:hypothetical protein
MTKQDYTVVGILLGKRLHAFDMLNNKILSDHYTHATSSIISEMCTTFKLHNKRFDREAFLTTIHNSRFSHDNKTIDNYEE